LKACKFSGTFELLNFLKSKINKLVFTVKQAHIESFGYTNVFLLPKEICSYKFFKVHLLRRYIKQEVLVEFVAFYSNTLVLSHREMSFSSNKLKICDWLFKNNILLEQSEMIFNLNMHIKTTSQIFVTFRAKKFSNFAGSNAKIPWKICV
jgi:hypothetical protein